MKYILSALFAALCISCVQPAHVQSVTFSLDAEGVPRGSIVAVRGSDRPLSWDTDTIMEFDSISNRYICTVKIVTGYKFTEYKYVINGGFESLAGGNRRLSFDESRRTIVVDRLNRH